MPKSKSVSDNITLHVFEWHNQAYLFCGESMLIARIPKSFATAVRADIRSRRDLISLATSHIEGHSTGRGTTGGPIDCLLISPTRHLWIKRKKPTMRYSTLEDFAIAADAGLIPVRTF